MPELAALIREEVLSQGPISFERFMELALYHPEFGYYRRQDATPRTGRGGDFFTSVSVGPLFGRLLAGQFLEMWEKLQRPTPFWIVEQGAEDGQLASDILAWCRTEVPKFFDAICYALIDPHAPSRRVQEAKVRQATLQEKVVWLSSLEDCAGLRPSGVFFSNELLDAFPVRAIARRNGEWLERRVGVRADHGWIEKTIEDPDLSNAVSQLALPDIDGYVTEINLRARNWMKDAGRVIERGYFLTIDYGFPSSLYYARFRTNGTLTAYQKHERTGDVLRDPGRQDITAHVDFTALAQAGERAGLATLGFLDQQHFLMGVAHAELSGATVPQAGIAEHLRAWNTLTHPGYLGSRFQVLLQAQNAPADLAGLRYARPGELDVGPGH